MKENNSPITEEILQKYVDERLTAEECRNVEIYLDANPDEKKRIQEYQRINLTLKNLHDAELSRDVLNSDESSLKEKNFRFYYRMAASFLLFLSGLASGLYFSGNNFQKSETSALLAQQAYSAYIVYTPEVKHPIEVDASQRDHLNKWLSKRIGKSMSAPDLTSAGFELLGGRLLHADANAVALFMYQNKNGIRLTLYLQGDPKDSKNTALRFYRKNDIKTVYWTDEKLGYALCGELPKNEMYAIANQIYSEMENS